MRSIDNRINLLHGYRLRVSYNSADDPRPVVELSTEDDDVVLSLTLDAEHAPILELAAMVAKVLEVAPPVHRGQWLQDVCEQIGPALTRLDEIAKAKARAAAELAAKRPTKRRSPRRSLAPKRKRALR
jgi:hypothetical protein